MPPDLGRPVDRKISGRTLEGSFAGNHTDPLVYSRAHLRTKQE